VTTAERIALRLEKFNAKYQPDLNSDEAIRDRQVKVWRSKVYSHFVMPPPITTMESRDIGYRFACETNPSKYVTRSRVDESTSNLARHVQTCGSSTSSPSPSSVSTYNLGRFRYLVAAWSARRARPHSIIEDEEFREIITMLNSDAKIHSHQTVSRDISDMYHHSRVAVALHLQSIKQRLHIALDGWTAPNVFSFLGVTVQYFEKGNICSFVLDFVKYDHIFISCSVSD
jgi:hypothetical protein